MSFKYDERVDGPLPNHDKATLVAQLRALVPDMQLLHDPEDLRPFECDGLSAYRTTPMLVALPDKVEQVQALLKFASANKVPIVARGAQGEIRAIESPTHRFFIATLFQPQLSSTEKKPHPVVLAFVQAAADWGRKKLDDSVLE